MKMNEKAIKDDVKRPRMWLSLQQSRWSKAVGPESGQASGLYRRVGDLIGERKACGAQSRWPSTYPPEGENGQFQEEHLLF